MSNLLFGANYNFLPTLTGLAAEATPYGYGDNYGYGLLDGKYFATGTYTTDIWGQITSIQLKQTDGETWNSTLTITYDGTGRASSATYAQTYTLPPSDGGTTSSYNISWTFSYNSNDLSQVSAYEGTASYTYAYTPASGGSGTSSYQFTDANFNPDPYGTSPTGPYVFNEKLGLWIGGTVFTAGSDDVDFNELFASQLGAVYAGADLYHSLAGNDTVDLPNVANYQLTSTVAWDPAQTFYAGPGNDRYGGDGNYNINMGPGNTSVIIAGDGSSTITGGSGNDTIEISGNGDNTINIGTGPAAVSIDGTGTNTINGDLNGTLSISGGGTLDLTGSFSGSASIGANSTLELDDPADFTGTISGLAVGDTIDLADVPFSKNGIAVLNSSNVLQVLENNASYGLNLSPPTIADFEDKYFQLSSDGDGGTDITIGPGTAGFDTSVYNAGMVETLWNETNLSAVGYYLISPNKPHSTWAANGVLQSLKSEGWHVEPIYVGEQDPAALAAGEKLNGVFNYDASGEDGTADGQNAAQELAGFPAGTTVFLDVESFKTPLSTDMQDYIENWCTAVSAAGYTPGIYCARGISAGIATTIAAIEPGAPLWIANTGTGLTAVPAGVTVFPGITPSQSGVAGATAWQYQQSYAISGFGAAIDLDTANVSTGTVDNESVSSPVSNVAVNDNVDLSVQVDGTATNTVINNGGTENVFGSDIGASINDGGYQYVMAGGTTTDATVYDPGIQIVSVGSTATDTTLSGGDQGVYGTAIGTDIESGGYEEVFSGGVTSDATINGGTLELQAGAAITGPVSFEGTGGTLTVDGTSIPTNVIDGFAAGDGIDLEAVSFDGGGSATLETGNVLQFELGGQSYELAFNPSQSFPDDSFQLTPDNSGGTNVGLANVVSVASGASSFGALVSSGAFEDVYGTAHDTEINTGGTETVYAGGADLGASVSDGGNEYILSEGTSTDAEVDGSGDQTVLTGGAATGASLNGGEQDVGGNASGTVIGTGGLQVVENGGTAANTLVTAGGEQDVDGGTASGTVVDTGGVEDVYSGGNASATLAGGEIDVYGGTNMVTAGSGDGAAVFADPRADYSAVFANGGQVVVADLSDPTESTTLAGIDELAFADMSIFATYEPAGGASGELSSNLWMTGLAALTGASQGPALAPPSVSGPMFAAGRAGNTGGGGDQPAVTGAGDVTLLAQMSQSSVSAASAAPAAAPPAASIGAEALALALAHAPS